MGMLDKQTETEAQKLIFPLRTTTVMSEEEFSTTQ